MKRILVTGGNGFLGKNVQSEFLKQKHVQQLKHPHFDVIFPTSEDCDLLDFEEFDKFVFDYKPDTFVHLGALCGGIGLNKKVPADLISKNLQMGINVFEIARKRNVKFVHTLGSVCGYPSECPVPFNEDNLFNGFPHFSNAPYGISKRVLLIMGNAYRDQYGIGGSHLIPVNMFGIYDHFDLENSHVIPALINKFLNAKENNLTEVFCWGTGTDATREFLYAEDCASAVVKVSLNDFSDPHPINLGTGRDISIKELSELIASLVDYTGEIIFTGEVGDGQKKRMLDVSRAKELLGWEAKTDLRTGLIKTIEWYKANK